MCEGFYSHFLLFIAHPLLHYTKYFDVSLLMRYPVETVNFSKPRCILFQVVTVCFYLRLYLDFVIVICRQFMFLMVTTLFFLGGGFNAIPGHDLPLEGFAITLIRRITPGRTPLDEWSARRRYLYLTTHNTHNKHLCPPWDSKPQSKPTSGRRPPL
jgi:hypothetical protein